MKPSSARKTAEIALICGIAVSVLLFGGTDPVSFTVVQVLLFGAAAWVMIKGGDMKSVRPVYLIVPASLAIWGFVQMWVSRAPYQTRAELLILLTCFAGFYLALLAGGERARKRRLVRMLVALGAGEAFYGLIQYLANWQAIWWYTKKYDLEEATGTYINRNHFAGFLEMVLPFAVALALYESEKLAFSRTHRLRRAGKANLFMPSISLWLVIAVVLMAALVFSRSRMGLLAASVSLLVMFSLNALQKRTASIAVGLAFVVLTLSLAGWIGLRPALSRFEDLRQELPGQQETRISIWPGAVKLISEHPMVGNGLGTFPVVYTRYQTGFLSKYVNHAHNDYLEFASDLGIPAALVLFGSIVWVLVRAMWGFFRAESRLERNLALASVGSIVAILLHSLADFNLYIPANALVFAAILGMASAPNGEMAHAEARA